MLKENIVRKVQELLRQQMSQRAIARKLGIDRATVSKIAHGKHPSLQDARRKRRQERPPQSCPPRRCPECEQMVEYQPCVYCKTRNAVKRGVRGILELAHKTDIEPLGLDLVAEQQRRYEKVRARKLRRIRLAKMLLEGNEGSSESTDG